VTYEVLHTFQAYDGGNPSGRLALDSTGNLYGSTRNGGSDQWGTVFKLDTAGNETVLHNFTGGADGATPFSGVILDQAGNLYGTAWQGGTGCDFITCGVVFKIDPAGNESVLHTFNGADGFNPGSSLIRDADGNLYGTTQSGGDLGYGLVFKLNPATGTETVLYSFTGGADGFGPGELIVDSAGNFYGTTTNGGDFTNCNPVGCGVAFKLDPTTGTETVLYTFAGGNDGNIPGGLVQDASGNLFGGTDLGGVPCPQQGINGCGVVFRLDPTGQETVLYSFTGGSDGSAANAPLWMDDTGMLYGIAVAGGPHPCYGLGCGVIFQFDPSNGQETLLYAFTGGADSAVPSGGLIRDAAGAFYGTAAGNCSDITNACGAPNGVVFKLTLTPEFAISASALSPDTISPGQTSTSKLGVSSIGGFSDSVTLSCTVQPSPELAPRCVIPSSANPRTSATLSVSTTGTSAASRSNNGFGPLYALWLPLIGLVMANVRRGSGHKPRKKASTAVLTWVLFGGLLSAVACGGTPTPPPKKVTPSGTYTITVSGTSGSLVHSTMTTLTVR
jgi:uncharacterized repeat protein (TIGR03803 family)